MTKIEKRVAMLEVRGARTDRAAIAEAEAEAQRAKVLAGLGVLKEAS